MKQFLTLLVIIIAAISLYTIYGLLSFQADEQKPFVFNDPVLPAEIQEEERSAAVPSLSAGEELQKDRAVEAAQKAFETYRIYRESAPAQVKDTIATITNMIEAWSLPAYFPSTTNDQVGGLRVLQRLFLDVTNVVSDKETLDCSSKTPPASVVIGDSGKDSLSCRTERDTSGKSQDKDIVFIGGPGDDRISDVTGSRIVNGGTGDDTITLGKGRSLIVLDAAWGHDTLTIDCTGANVSASEIQKGFAIPWVHKTTNFIILGDGIDPKDVSWKENVLTNMVTGDTLTVNQNCFTIVPTIQ